jgi:hypothetical protein
MSKYACNPEVILREEEKEGGLLFNPDTNQVIVLNSTGVFIWRMCDGSHNVEDIIQEIQNEFEGASPDVLKIEIPKFLDMMVNAHLVGVVI